jgi:hypothetical protein
MSISLSLSLDELVAVLQAYRGWSEPTPLGIVSELRSPRFERLLWCLQFDEMMWSLVDVQFHDYEVELKTSKAFQRCFGVRFRLMIPKHVVLKEGGPLFRDHPKFKEWRLDRSTDPDAVPLDDSRPLANVLLEEPHRRRRKGRS